MAQPLRPTPARAFEQPELAIRIPAAAADPTSHVERSARNAITVSQTGFVAIAQRHDRRSQLRRDTLVGVHTEDPIMRGGVCGKLFLSRKSRPGVPNHPRTTARRDLAGVVGGF